MYQSINFIGLQVADLIRLQVPETLIALQVPDLPTGLQVPSWLIGLHVSLLIGLHKTDPLLNSNYSNSLICQ